MNAEDRRLGMDRPITRRDFVAGTSVAIGATLLSSSGVNAFTQAAGGAQLAPEQAPDYYPPTRTGMRGAHPGSFEAAHAARGSQTYDNPEDTRESYDLVVVGGGLSGLAAAYYFRKKAGPSARILVLDNHDDFGGHAKRNEFVYNGRTMMATGGSAYMVAPSTWTFEAIQIIKELGIERGPTERGDRGIFRTLGLQPSVFFNKEKYGADKLVIGGSLNNPTPEFLAKTPLPAQAQADLVRLYKEKVDYLPGLTAEQKIERLQKMSYRDYLLNVAKVHPDVPPLLGGVWCLGTDTASAWLAYYRYKPGFAGLGVERPPDSPESPEHTADDLRLPAGNSDIARLIVRALIPAALAPGSFVDVQTKRVNYATLDDASSPTRIRLNSTAVRVQHVGDAPKALFLRDARDVAITYLRGGRAYKVRGKNVVLACNNAMIPYLCPEMPEAQKKALHRSVRAVNQSTNVLFRDFKAFAALKVSNVACPNSFYGSFSLGSTQSLGDLKPPKDPSEPVLVGFSTAANSGLLANETMVRELCKGSPPPVGTPMQDQFRAVRTALLSTPFETFERAIRSQSSRALAGSDFDPARDIVAITVNRWPHGFAMSRNSLFEHDTEETPPNLIARQRFGHITIANSDASGVDLVQTAFDEAFRAVRDLEPNRYGYYERI
jgi:spermidine dehydrogenase